LLKIPAQVPMKIPAITKLRSEEAMAFFIWDQSYSVKVSQCDEDHKKLFALLNALHDAMKAGKGSQVIEKVIDDLASYTKYHFSQEEMLLRQTNYSDIVSHQAQHRIFVKKVEDFQKNLKTGNLAQSIAIAGFLTDWLATHIKRTDRKYSAHLNAHGVS
jgi:hemerythrin